MLNDGGWERWYIYIGCSHYPACPLPIDMSLTPNKQDDATVECREQDSGSSRTPPEQPNEQLLPLDLRPEAEKQLLRTLDMRLLPAMILINFINLIDVSAPVGQYHGN